MALDITRPVLTSGGRMSELSDLLALAGDRALMPAERNRLRGKTAGGRSKSKAHGYAAMPGTGPSGETCGSCRHLHRNRMAKTYLKCGLMRAHWTGGTATDVRSRSPACRNWQNQEGDPS